MARPGTLFPAYRLHQSTGQAVVTLGGKDFYLGTFDSAASRQEYDRLIRQWVAAGRPQHVSALRPISISELCAAYWKFAKSYYSPHGRPSGEVHPVKAVLKLLKSSLGRKPAIEFGPLALKVASGGNDRKGLGQNDNQQAGAQVRRIFRWAAAEELVPSGIFQALEAVDGLRAGRTAAKESKPVPPVPDATVEATLPHLPPVVADMVRLQRLTGARPQDVCQIRPLDVTRSKSVWEYRPAQHKNLHRGLDRVILVGPRAQAVLLPYLDRDPNAYCLSPRESEVVRRQKQHVARKTPLKYGNSPGTNVLDARRVIGT